MAALIVLALLLGVTVSYLGLEAYLHTRRLAQIPIRVHVNGTRGKSSVTRLIAAGLRGGGLRVAGKTTGTTARMILPDGRELPIFRPAGPNVREQIRVVRVAAGVEADVLIIECMALQPELQWLSERWFVRATHGVITNARPDHLDVMGPGPDDVAWALCGMVPREGQLYTCEQDRLHIIEMACQDRHTTLVPIDEARIGAVSDADLEGFGHREHRDNLALALKVCEDLGVDREVALAGMWRARPDPGVLSEHHLDFFGRQIVFYNAFAANDPVSSLMIWRFIIERHPEITRHVALVNCRADRADRSRQLAESIAEWPEVGRILLVGSGTTIFVRAAIARGVSPMDLVTVEGAQAEQIFESVVDMVGDAALVVGLGNIGGPGLEIVRMFRNRGRPMKIREASPRDASEPAVEEDTAHVG